MECSNTDFAAIGRLPGWSPHSLTFPRGTLMNDVHRPRTTRRAAVRPSSIRRSLRTRGICKVLFVYCVFDGCPRVSLSVAPARPATTRIALSGSAIRALKRLFRRWTSARDPAWRDGPDSAGVLSWDLMTDRWTHDHFGYRHQFVRERYQSRGDNGMEQDRSAARNSPLIGSGDSTGSR